MRTVSLLSEARSLRQVTPIKTVIKRLPQGDPIPSGTPRRYVQKSTGYIILRWRVGPKQLVECLEHRAVMGNPKGMHVHHKNHDRTDNRPENLEVLSPAEHGAEHRLIDPAEVRRLYESGMSYPQIAERLGCDNSVALRAGRKVGLVSRSSAEAHTVAVDDRAIAAMYVKGYGTYRIGRAFGVSSTRVLKSLRQSGVTVRGPGRVKGMG